MAATTTILDVRHRLERILKIVRKGAILQGEEFADTEVMMKTGPITYDVATFNTAGNATILAAKPGVAYRVFGIDINVMNSAATACSRMSVTCHIKGTEEHAAVCYVIPSAVNAASKYTPASFITDENSDIAVSVDVAAAGGRGLVYYKEVLLHAV